MYLSELDSIVNFIVREEKQSLVGHDSSNRDLEIQTSSDELNSKNAYLSPLSVAEF